MSTNPDFAREEGVAGGKAPQSEISSPGGAEPGTRGPERGQSRESMGGRMGGGAGRSQELREELQKMGQAARDASHEQWENLRERGMEKARQLEDRIVDQPLKSVAIAAFAGFVMGLMWMRR